MPIIRPKVDLKNSFPYTRLDLEDNGPKNVPDNGHKQNFTPSNKFKDSTEGGQGKLWNDATQTGIGFNGPGELDLQNNGPQNASKYNHQQQWTPDSEYTDDVMGQRQGGLLRLKGFDGPENLDIETNSKTFFPKSPSGKQQFGFTQQWGPNTNEYRLADLGEDGVGLYNGDNSLKGNLDVENNDPRNEGNYKHQQIYTPSDTYLSSIDQKGLEEGSKLYTKGFDRNYNSRGYEGDHDIENNDPNRSNPLGAKSSDTIKSTLNGRIIQTQIQHPYTPSKPYITVGKPIIGDDINAVTGAKNQL